MKRLGNYVLKFCLIIISVLLIDGGKAFISSGTEAHLLITTEADDSLELPDQYNTLTDFDKCIRNDNIQTVSDTETSSDSGYEPGFKSQDYIFKIWQPPKSL